MGVHTFVICAYQKSPYLLSCIRSLKSQTEETEIICTTSTPSVWLTEIMEKQGIPLYVREGESDIQADWNFAIEKAEGEFVTIAHQDDMYGKHYVEELKKSYERWPDMTVFMTDAVTIKNGNVQRWSLKELVKKTLRLPLRFHGLADREAVKKSGLLLGNPVMCPSCAYRKNYLPDPIFHSEYRYALDWDCMVDLAKWPGRFVCVEKPLLYYRIHDGAATKVCIENHRRETEERQMFERFWPEPVVEFLMKFYKKASQEW